MPADGKLRGVFVGGGRVSITEMAGIAEVWKVISLLNEIELR